MVEKQSIISFVSSYPNKRTRISYQACLLNFSEQIVGTKKRKSKKVSTEERKVFDEEMLAYLNKGKSQEDYFKDVQKFAVWLQCKPAKSADLNLTAVKELFLANGIDFNRQQLKEIRRAMPKGGVATVENELDVDTFKSILEHCDITGKTLFLALKPIFVRLKTISISVEHPMLKSLFLITLPLLVLKILYSQYNYNQIALAHSFAHPL